MALENEGATPDVEQVIDQTTDTQTLEAPVSIDDTIRNTLAEIRGRGEGGEVGNPDAPDTPEEKAQRIRDEQGKFAKGAPPVVGADPANPAAATATPAGTPPDVAPNTWKKEAAAMWATLPPEVRAEATRREADFHKGIEGYKQAAGFGQAMERAITPYAATIQGLGITADKAVSEIMASDHVLRYGTPQQKQAKAIGLLQSYGIDIAGLQAPLQQENIDPNVKQLQDQVQQLTGWIQNQTQQGQQQEVASLNSEIATFSADPKHSHFESVKGHMAALLQAGQATSLADAYEQAIYANPATRQLVLAQQQAEQRAEAAKKAQAARGAASVNTRARSSMPVSQPIGTMEDTIRAKLRELQGA